MKKFDHLHLYSLSQFSLITYESCFFSSRVPRVLTYTSDILPSGLDTPKISPLLCSFFMVTVSVSFFISTPSSNNPKIIFQTYSSCNATTSILFYKLKIIHSILRNESILILFYKCFMLILGQIRHNSD